MMEELLGWIWVLLPWRLWVVVTVTLALVAILAIALIMWG